MQIGHHRDSLRLTFPSLGFVCSLWAPDQGLTFAKSALETDGKHAVTKSLTSLFFHCYLKFNPFPNCWNVVVLSSQNFAKENKSSKFPYLKRETLDSMVMLLDTLKVPIVTRTRNGKWIGLKNKKKLKKYTQPTNNNKITQRRMNGMDGFQKCCRFHSPVVNGPLPYMSMEHCYNRWGNETQHWIILHVEKIANL